MTRLEIPGTNVPYVHAYNTYPPGDHTLPEMWIHAMGCTGPGAVDLVEGEQSHVRSFGPFPYRALYMPIYVRKGHLSFQGQSGHVTIEGIKKDPQFLRVLGAAYAISHKWVAT